MFSRGRPSRSNALAATISACVGIEAAGDADHDALLDPDRLQPLRKPGDLDVVGLVAIEREPVRVVRHEREALDLPLQPDIRHRRVEPERDAAERLARRKVPPAVVVEGAHPRPLLAQEVEIDVGERHPAARRKAFGLGEQHAVLENLRLAVPGEVGRRLPCPGGRVEIGRQAAGGLRLAEKPPRLRLADRDVGGGEIGEHRGAGERRLGRGTGSAPRNPRRSRRAPRSRRRRRRRKEVRPERRLLPGECGSLRPRRRRRRQNAGARRIRGSSADGPWGRRRAAGRGARQARNCRGGRDAGSARRRAMSGISSRGRLDDVRHAALDRLEQGVLQQEVVDRVGRERKLGKERQGCGALVAGPRERRRSIAHWLPDRQARCGSVQAATRAKPCR